jgi:uncharacterized tellurite resistance protein B-like protein
MIDAIRAFVTGRIVANDAPAAANPGRGRGVELAACALLLELAHADGEFSPSEQTHIENALRRHFGIDDAELAALMQLAEAERSRSIDHFQFTREIAKHYDLGQKMVLAEVMWGVILADGTVDEHEAYIVRKVANLLELEPAYLSQARAAAAPDGR